MILFLLSSCAVKEDLSESEAQQDDIIRGVWIYYDELSMKNEKGDTAEAFRKKIEKIFFNCSRWGLNTVFVQVRPFADSFYPSEIFPWSEYLTGEQGKAVDYDPLQIMIECADEYGLSFHAWINPFRISYKSDIDTLCNNHPVHRLADSDAVYKSDNGIYFNPASLEAQKLILEGIREITENYDVDGIHIDDYFYPSTDERIDKAQYDLYVEGGGAHPLHEWRIESINAFVSGMYRAVKAVNPDIIVSISPAGNIDNNYQKHYADVKLWCSQKGFCDVIIPQIYFGFNHKTVPFKSCVQQWAELCDGNNVKLVCGIAAYKAVQPQNEEWENTDIVRQQTEYVVNSASYYGYCQFSYRSLTALEAESELPSDALSQK